MTFCSHSILPTATLLFHYLKYPKCTGNLNLHRPPHNNHHRSLFQVNTHARHSFSLSLLHSSQTILEAPPQLTPHEDAHFGPCSLRRQPRRHSWGRWSTAAHTQSHSAGGNCRTRFFPKPRAEGLTDRAKITPGSPTPGAQRGSTRPNAAARWQRGPGTDPFCRSGRGRIPNDGRWERFEVSPPQGVVSRPESVIHCLQVEVMVSVGRSQWSLPAIPRQCNARQN